ncbi:MAG: serine hydrolase domain-containing protein [Gemmatimonadaceae bacterium]
MPQSISRRSALATLAALAAGCRVSVSRSGAAAAPALLQGASDLASIMEVAGVPGLAVVQVSGTSVQANGRGSTRATEGRAVDGDTVFEAASLSKPVFAYVALQLAAERALDLDRPLKDYVPLPATDARSNSITARHVLSHSTGWRNWRNNMSQALVADFEPGSRFGYSGEGFYYLQRVVEKVTDTGILTLTRDRVFKPFGMARSSYMWAPWMDANRAEPHTNRGVHGTSYLGTTSKALLETAAAASVSVDTWRHETAERLLPSANRDVPVLPNFLLPNVAGSLATTANDYGRFLSRLMSDEATLRAMLTPTTRINRAIQWGVGVGLQTGAPGTTFWHWGDTFGFKNFFVADPAKRTAVAVFTNGQNGRAVYERVVREVRGDQPAFVWI